MKKTLSRTLISSAVGATLAVGGLAVAVAPAHAALSTPTNPTPLTDATQQVSGKWYTGLTTWQFSENVTAVTYDVTLSNVTGIVMQDYLRNQDLTFTGNTATFTKTVNGENPRGDYTIVKVSPTTVRITVALAAPTDTLMLATPRYVADSTAGGHADIAIDIVSATPASTGVAENITGETITTAKMVFADVLDVPVIAPAVAGLVLLAGTGAGGVAVARRRRVTQTA